jgi:hypothetical protein
MSETRVKRPVLRTPAGTARYPRLTKPDTKFNADGVYKIDLLLKTDAPGTTEFIESLDKAYAESVATAKKENKGKKVKDADKPYGPVLDKEGNETDEIKVGFKMSAVVRPKGKEAWEQRPALFDAKGKPLVNPKVGGGSTVKVAYEIVPFFTALIGAGISLRLKAVQIINLVEFGGKSASDFGFEAEESADADTAGDETPERTDDEAPAGDGASGDF